MSSLGSVDEKCLLALCGCWWWATVCGVRSLERFRGYSALSIFSINIKFGGKSVINLLLSLKFNDEAFDHPIVAFV